MAATAGQAQVLNLADPDGWHDDGHQAALEAFLVTCDLIGDELEPAGSAGRTPRFAHPIHRIPPEHAPGSVWHGCGEIETRGLETGCPDDPPEAYFLMDQGSGQIRLQDGPARDIQNWVRANPVADAALLNQNPSFVLFRKIDDLPSDKGPIGAMARGLTTMQSVVVEPAFTPLGMPAWIDKKGAAPLRRLMIAQDTGGAITGAQRGDFFFGTGIAAGEAARQVKDGDRMIMLLPNERAFAPLPES